MLRRLKEYEMEDILRAFWHSRGFVLASTLILGLLKAVLVFQQPNLYQSTARILVETQSPRVVQFQEVERASSYDRFFLQTEYKVIGSKAVMSRVIEELNLASFPPFSRVKDPVPLLTGMVSVDPVRGTKLVDISCASTKPELAARIANAVADAYLKINLERRRELTVGGAHWLQDEVQKMEERVRTAQLKLLEFREAHNTVDLGLENENSVLQRLQALNAALNKTREDRLDAELKYREKHPALQELLSKERELQLALFEQEQKILEQNRLSIEVNTLLREAKTSETIYNILLTRLKELSVQEGIQSNNAIVVDPAQIPLLPIGPARGRQISFFLIFGFVLGSTAALLREFFTETVRTRQDFERLLEIPFLGYIPLLPVEKGRGGRTPLLRLRHPKAGSAETLSAIRTTLEFILPSAPSHLLLITSAVPEEGKTTTSANLAIALHELGRKVLLVDADMRRPSLHRAFNLSLEPGLSAYLQGAASEQELIQTPESVEGLSVVSAGLTPAQPTDLLSSPQFRTLLESWSRQYQYVLVDSPPVLVSADASVLATCVEGVIYVLRANRTHSELALTAKQRLLDVGAKLVGGILNGARLEMERGYRYYYSYRYDQYRKSTKRSPPPGPREDTAPLSEETAEGA